MKIVNSIAAERGAEGSEVESVHELIGGEAVVQNCGDTFVGSASREVGQHKIDDVNQPEDALAPPYEGGAGEECPRSCVCHYEFLRFRMPAMQARRAAAQSTGWQTPRCSTAFPLRRYPLFRRSYW